MNSLIWAFAVVLTMVGATAGSIRRVSEGNEALVERLGRFHRMLTPGLNFWVLPVVDEVVVEASTREQILDIEPSAVITNDNVTVTVDAVVFWKILDLYRAYYEISDIQEALKNLVVTTLRSKMGQMNLQETYSSREDVNQALLQSLDLATEPWGVKVMRVEIQDVQIPDTMRKAIEDERAAQSRKKAMIAEAEGEKQAALAAAEGKHQAAVENAKAIAESVKVISAALPQAASTQEILRYLVAQRYVEANYELGQSTNSKVVFMNPRDLSESLSSLIDTDNPPAVNSPEAEKL